jgi:hypothetical protein
MQKRVTDTATREGGREAGIQAANDLLGPIISSLGMRLPPQAPPPRRPASAFALSAADLVFDHPMRSSPSPLRTSPLQRLLGSGGEDRGRDRGRDRDRSRSRSAEREGLRGRSERDESKSRSSLRDRSRVSMPANRLRLGANTPEADREVHETLGGRGRDTLSDGDTRERRSRSRSPARSLIGFDAAAAAGSPAPRDRPPPPPGRPPPSRSPTPRADTDSDAITHRSTLARAFRQRCQQLGAPLTCPFMACSGACQNPECDDCKNQSTYDPRKHGQIVAELKRRASGSFAFRWRDTG